MLVYCGESNIVRAQILENYFSKDHFVYRDDGISIISDNPHESIIIENSKELLIFAEGKITNYRKISFLPQYEYFNNNFFKKLEGYFCLIVWEKNRRRLFIINDKLGLNPLYYTVTPHNELGVSTKMKNLVRAFEIPMEIDFVALKQFALFNYILGERTYLRNVFRLKPGTAMSWQGRNITKEDYWNVSQFLSSNCVDENEFLKQFPKTFCEVISDWIYEKKKVGILLSGGYDSRTILACLYKLGVRGYAYTWDNPAIKEITIAQRLAEETGFKLKYLPFYPEEKDTERLIYEVGELTDFSFPLFHIGRYNALKQISDNLDIILSGQGEIIRITPIPNDYISPSTLAYIYKDKPLNITEQFFQIRDGEDGLFEAFEYRNLSFSEQLTCFLLYNAYRDDYGILRYGENKIMPVAMPFFDGRILELLLKSPFSIARLKTWKRNILFTFRTRLIYYAIVKKMAPHLLNIPLDRGYAQRFDSSHLNIILTAISGLRNRVIFKKKRKEIPPWWKFAYNLLSEDRTLNRAFYNKLEITNSLERYPHWTPEESYALEKVARFELWFRHFIESN